MEYVSFITVEDGTDLIVSFAVLCEDVDDVKSLMLLRTPEFEFPLEDHERGVSVSYEDFPDGEGDLLEAIEFEGHEVRIVTRYHRYQLDVYRVDEEELAEAKQVLRKMNFDNRFRLTIV